MGGGSAGRTATGVGARELAGFEVEPDPVSGASLRHPASVTHKAAQAAAVP
jgi:hypothetical protein